MTWDGRKYIKLLLSRTEGKADRWLIALRTTADFYGWTETYPLWEPRVTHALGKFTCFQEPGRKGQMFTEGGKRLRICRHPTSSGYPRGMTNSFKVSSNCTLSDVAEVAHFVKVDWYWMLSPYGERISRIRWEDMYQSGNSWKRRGLVSA